MLQNIQASQPLVHFLDVADYCFILFVINTEVFLMRAHTGRDLGEGNGWGECL